MTAEKYPKCIKCRIELNPQDSRGWEKIDLQKVFPALMDANIWICPNCIAEFQHTKDIRDKLEQEIQKYNGFFKVLNELLEENKGI